MKRSWPDPLARVAGCLLAMLLVSHGNSGFAQLLMPGDANQDFEFNPQDLVQVQISAKYLTGLPATWLEGDWDGAPGGSPGSPPPGDGFFNETDIVFSLQIDTYLRGPYAAPSVTAPGEPTPPATVSRGGLLAPGGAAGDSQTSVFYDAFTGEIAVDAPGFGDLTAIHLASASGIFTGDPAANLGGLFDNDVDGSILKATHGGSFGSLSFGNVAQPGLSIHFVLSDLSANGALAGGGNLGPVDLIYVPEPVHHALLPALVLLGVAASRRRR